MTTNIELEEMAKKYDIPIVTILPKDLLFPVKQKEGGYIINLDNSNGQGTHWVGLYLLKYDGIKYAFYMDSYGMPAPKEIEEYALKWTKNPIYFIENTKKFQALKSGYCGQYSLMFIHKMDHRNKENPYKKFNEYLNSFKLNLN